MNSNGIDNIANLKVMLNTETKMMDKELKIMAGGHGFFYSGDGMKIWGGSGDSSKI